MAVISILSGKGGVGKTTITSNIATAIANEFKRKVIILDTNVTSSHIRLHFGMHEEMKNTLKDVIRDEDMLEEATYSSEMTGVNIVPSPESLKGLDLDKLRNLASHLAASEYNYVIIDSAPGFRENTENVIRASDKIVIVTNPYLPDVSDSLKLMELVEKNRKEAIVVVNKVRGKKYEMTEAQIKKMLDIKDFVKIPEDEKVPESISHGVPVTVFAKGSKVSMALKKLAGQLIGEEYKPSLADRVKWFFGA
ncbi:MAG: MinD/ParA family protein [Candidatus Aenigmarchaeota archaeon]|nr:MinD/ParA family protein [Candidatus Aenigmarchaeota archaeon]